jgi:hypothetical protein
MKTTIKSILTLALVMGLGIMAHAQKTLSAPASATILTDLTITLEGTIAFGNLSATTAAVVLDAKGADNVNTGTVTSVARFKLAGADNAVTVTYDATVILTESVGVTMDMTPVVVGAAVSENQGSATPVASPSTVILESNEFYLWVGGTIPPLNGQATGEYTGIFNINVEYN